MKSLKEIIESSHVHKDHDMDIDSDDLYLQKLKKRLEAERYSSDTKDRKWLAVWTAVTVSLWLGGVIYILMHNDKTFCLSDTVIVTLLGTTTLNVLGLSFIVLRGHFRDNKN